MIPRVAVLLVAHAPLASALAKCAEHVYACAPEALGVLAFQDVEANADVETEVGLARATLLELERGRGVLVLTDIFGATPANVAQRLAVPGQCEVVAGVNLPMLLRTLCYCDQMTLTDLAEKAVYGGSSGVMKLASAPPQNQRAVRDTCPVTENKTMPLRDCTISNKLGLHARASAKLTQLAAKFPCEVWMTRNTRRVNAKSIMGVMMLAAGKGSVVTLETIGEQENEALDAIEALINNKFDEGQ